MSAIPLGVCLSKIIRQVTAELCSLVLWANLIILPVQLNQWVQASLNSSEVKTIMCSFPCSCCSTHWIQVVLFFQAFVLVYSSCSPLCNVFLRLALHRCKWYCFHFLQSIFPVQSFMSMVNFLWISFNVILIKIS